MTELPSPSCPMGYTIPDLDRILGAQSPMRDAFRAWHAGQTGSICEGRQYNHSKRVYEPDECQAHPHGMVVYEYDLRRFMQRDR